MKLHAISANKSQRMLLSNLNSVKFIKDVVKVLSSLNASRYLLENQIKKMKISAF